MIFANFHKNIKWNEEDDQQYNHPKIEEKVREPN